MTNESFIQALAKIDDKATAAEAAAKQRIQAERAGDIAALKRIWSLYNGDAPIPSGNQPIPEETSRNENGALEEEEIGKKERIRRVLPAIDGEIVDSVKVTATLRERYPNVPDIDTPVISKVLREFRDEGLLLLLDTGERGRKLTTYQKTKKFYEIYGR